MARDGDELQGLSARMGAVEGDITTIKLILDSVVQKLKRLSLKIEEQSLIDGLY